MTSAASNPPSAADRPLSPARALLVLMAVVVLLAGYFGLAYSFHFAAIFAGSLFLFFWVGVEKAAPAAFLATLVGAIGGVANAGLFHASVARALAIDPGLAAVVGLSVLLLVLYMLLIQKAPILCNQSYLLFVTVGSIPQLADNDTLVSLAACILLSAAYFGSIFWILSRFGPRREPNAAAEPIAAVTANSDDLQP